MSRRRDHQLRSAITSIERMLLSQPNLDSVLFNALEQAMIVLDADFGFFFRCQTCLNADEEIPWVLSGCIERQADELRAIDNLSSSCTIPNDMQKTLLSGRCFIGQHECKEYIPLPHNHPEITHYFAIPIIDARFIHGVLFICNTPAPIDHDTETRFRPLIASVTCIARTASKREQFQQSDEQEHINAIGVSQKVSNLFDTLFNAVMVLNENGIITYCNEAAQELLLTESEHILGQSIAHFIPANAPKLEQRFASPLSDNQIHPVWRGVQVSCSNGQDKIVDMRAAEWKVNGSSMRVIIMDDVSERMHSVANYQTILQRFQILTNTVLVGILQINESWECTYVNDTWCDYSQLTPEETLGKGWLRGIHLDDVDRVIASLHNHCLQYDVYRDEFRLQSPLGKTTWVEINACGLFNDKGESAGLLITFNDITARLQNEHRLRNLAERDQLTGLVNRAFFNDRVAVALRGVPRFGAAALMFLDLDNFKYINDTMGHDAGDQLLKAIAACLQQTVRKVDTIARLGGDEFTVLITNISSPNAATVIASKIIDALSHPIFINGEPIYVTCSIGISLAEDDGAEAQTLLKQADSALYKAKNAGKNQYKFYTHELDAEASLHILLKQTLKKNPDDYFRLVYQPQVDARTHEIVGLEALTRWNHVKAPNTQPSQFIKLIEESGLIHDFSHWLLHCALRTLKTWQQQGLKIPQLSLNVSAKQFRSKRLAQEYKSACEQHGIAPSAITLEVTETALLDDPQGACSVLKELKLIGFKIALDDFGTGYSSLSYLRNMPLDYVKIDRSFIVNVLDSENSAKIVAAIIALVDTLTLKVIAEGIDSEEARQWLIDNHCYCQQGFYFYQPLEKDAVTHIFQQQHDENRAAGITSRSHSSVTASHQDIATI